MWSPIEKVWSKKSENEESNFWHTYSFLVFSLSIYRLKIFAEVKRL